MVDCRMFYAVSTIFLPCNDGYSFVFHVQNTDCIVVVFFNFFTVNINVDHVIVLNPGKGRRCLCVFGGGGLK